MTLDLAAFSDWTLAMLVRLFIYPGGLYLLLFLLLLRAVRGGIRALSPHALRGDLSSANLLSLAVAWAAISLAPLPGAAILPFPVDWFALSALPLLSLLLDINIKRAVVWRQAYLGSIITLALLLPTLQSQTLHTTGINVTFTLVATLLSVALGLLALSRQDMPGLSGDVCWLAWLGLGISAGWRALPVVGAKAEDSFWVVCLCFLLAVVALNTQPRRTQLQRRAALWSVLSAPLPVLLALPALLALLALLLALR